jgi:hypothetical protein
MQRTRSPRTALRGLLGLLLLLPPKPVAAEPAESHADPKTATLTTSLVTPFFGAYYLEGNVRASNALAALFNVSYLSLDNEDWTTNTGTVGAGVSYYCNGEALRGWYAEAGSELLLSSWRHQPSGKVAPIVPGFSVAAVLGYRFIWSGPVLDLGAGAVVLHFPRAQVETATGTTPSDTLTKVYPVLKLNAGWAF